MSQIYRKFFTRVQPLLHIFQRIIHGLRRPGDNMFYPLVPIDDLQPEIPILEHSIENDYILQRQLQELQPLLDILLCQVEILQCGLQELVDLVHMSLQYIHDLFVILRNAVDQEVYAEGDLCHELP